jgi:hypothetical protein
MYMAEFCPCGSLKVNGVCSNRKCPHKTSMAREWIVDGTLYYFKRSLTYAEAVEAVKNKADVIIPPKKPENDYIKPWTHFE